MKRKNRSRTGYDKHHRKPKSRGGNNHPSNISIVRANQHRAWHVLFGNMMPNEIAQIINSVWISSDWELVARKKVQPKPVEPFVPQLWE